MNYSDPRDWLFGDAVTAERFFAQHWQAKPYFVQRNAPGHFDGVLTAADIENLVNCSNARYPEILLGRADQRIAPALYARECAINGVTIHEVQPHEVARLFVGGASVMLRSIHTGHPEVMALTRRLEQSFCRHMTAICFVSPPGAATFPRHTDPTGTLVLQLAGSKHWLIDTGEGTGSRLITLDPGSVLYLPPAWPHFVINSDSISISLNYAIGTEAFEGTRLPDAKAFNITEFRCEGKPA